MGVFSEAQDRVFGLTPLAECLLEDRMRKQVYYLCKQFELSFAPAFDYSFRSARKVRLQAHRTARHFTDLYERLSFFIPPGTGDPDLYGGIHFEEGALL